VAHDFNNLLNVIGGYTELALGRLDESHPSRDDLTKIGIAARRAADLTRKLLAFSRRQILQVKPHDVNHVLDGFSHMFGRILGEDIEVRVVPSEDPLVVRADAGQLDQVLLNLCTNARQAMPKGGRLEIETTRATPSAAALAPHAWVQPGEFAVLSVRDTGVGMDALTLDRIFEPFFTTKTDGTGLGLPTVYGIVRQHHGFVEVDSRPGKGTSFRIFLPLADDEVAIEPVDVARTTPGGNEVILVAEDEEMLRDLVEETLAALGYRVILAADGQYAIEEFERRREEIDLVILDAVMPRLSGPDAYLRMHSIQPDLRAIFVSGHAPESIHLTDLLDREGVCFVPKPFLPQTLATKVREVLDASDGPREV
jgi:two-component system cell cycle sensor histidine kinase/response regulator CckA